MLRTRVQILQRDRRGASRSRHGGLHTVRPIAVPPEPSGGMSRFSPRPETSAGWATYPSTLRYQLRMLIRLLLLSVQSSCEVEPSRQASIDVFTSGTAQKV